MKKKYFSIIQVIILLFICFFILIQSSEARRGCCSWHGGVCNCAASGQKCCDGTSLSATCAPYYDPCVERVVLQCSTRNAGACDGRIFTQCEQEAYDNCKNEENFWIEHENSIKDMIKILLEREVTDQDINFYKNVSKDIKEIETLIKNSEEYNKLQGEKNIEAAKSRDSDNDGLSDYDEDNVYYTDSNNPDTDEDGYNDKDEIETGNDPLNPPEEKTEITEDKLKQEDIIDDRKEDKNKKEEAEKEVETVLEEERISEVSESEDGSFWLYLLVFVVAPYLISLPIIGAYFFIKSIFKPF